MKKLFSIFAATALMLSFVACDKKDKSKDEPAVEPTAVELNINSEDGLLIWGDACDSLGYWLIMAQNKNYFITLSNAGSVDAAAGTYTVDKLDAKYSYIIDFAKDSAKVDLQSGSITVAIDKDDNVTIKGSFVGSDNITYNVNLQYLAPKFVPSDMTFQLTENATGITVTPSNDEDPWDYMVVSAAAFAYYGGADGVAEVVWEYYGDYYAEPGEYTFTWDALYEMCVDDDEKYAPGDYYLVVWGSSEAGVTTDAAYKTFVAPAENNSAPAKAPAKALRAHKGAKKTPLSFKAFKK